MTKCHWWNKILGVTFPGVNLIPGVSRSSGHPEKWNTKIMMKFQNTNWRIW